MSKFVADYLCNNLNKRFKLGSIEAEEVVRSGIEYIKGLHDIKGKKITASAIVPIFNRNTEFVELLPPYEDLEDATLLMQQSFDNTEGKLSQHQKQDFASLINLYYKTQFNQNCEVLFFKEKIYEVSGILIFVAEDRVLLMPFSLNETDFYQTLY